MRVAARAHRVTVLVHAVEDAGAVCGARPRGRWLLTARLPVNCPKCLLDLSHPRFALCETLTRPRQLHVRELGDHGFKPRDPIDSRTLCGLLPVFDVEMLAGATTPDGSCARCAKALKVR